MLWRYVLCAVLLAVLWISNAGGLASAIRKRITSEVYIHTGLGFFFTLLAVEYPLNPFGGLRVGIPWVRVLGYVLYAPSVYLLFASHRALKQKAHPEDGDLTVTTVLVNTGIYAVVRQPMTLGMFIWSLALILVFQSLFSLVLGIPAAVCFWISAREEARYNMEKFGEEYNAYMNRVPMWNLFRRPRTG